MTDPFVGQLVFFRVYSGVSARGDARLQPSQGPQGAHRPPAADARQRAQDIKEVRAGDIAAAVGLKDATTGDTLCDPRRSSRSRRWSSPTR
jgi:elongation factor G